MDKKRREELGKEQIPKSIYYILKSIKLGIHFWIPNSLPNKVQNQKIGKEWIPNYSRSRDWRAVGEILHTDILREIAFYFLEKGAATSLILQNELNYQKRTVNMKLAALKVFGVIEPAHKLREPHFRGKPPTMYQTPDATVDQINEAYELHRKLRSPKYRAAREVAQTILEDYLSKKPTMEITYTEIVVQVKKMKISFNTPDIADLAAKYLHEQGVRIWR